MNWNITYDGFQTEEATALENRFLIGNGYLGVRGSLEEYTKEQLPAVNLAGLYDQVGDAWREPLNAPNGLYTYPVIDGEMLRLQDTVRNEEGEIHVKAESGRSGETDALLVSHNMRLDFRHGILHRETVWKVRRGRVTIRSQRFADRTDIHRICMRYEIETDFHAEADIYTGIDGDVWDINGPHYDEMWMDHVDGSLHAEGMTHEKAYHVHVLETVQSTFPSEDSVISEPDHVRQLMRRISFVTEPGKAYVLDKAVSVYTDQDEYGLPDARESLQTFLAGGYEEAAAAHCRKWESIWQYGAVEIDGDEEAERALNYSLYHLQSIAPRHTDSLSIPARGLSGQTYKGAVFWDTEMFILDYFLFTDPAAARSFLKYRVDTLPGAKHKAKAYGYAGAFYACESQEGGFDACSDYNVTDVFTGRPMRTYFRDKQVHISAAVVYGLQRYTEITGDQSLLADGGFEAVVECARFYESLLLCRAAAPDRYEIHDIIGPDEYHERVNNNGYTNRMAKLTLDAAADILDRPETLGEEAAEKIRQLYNGSGEEARSASQLAQDFRREAERLYIPQPDPKDKIIEQFDGYRQLEDCSVDTVRGRLLDPREYWGGAYGMAAHTQVIKQADVVTMLNLFSGEYEASVLEANWQYYESRTEHGSSLSASMYAMLACKCGMPEKAYPFFIKSAKADLVTGGKEWAGLIYIGGTHPAAAGGAYMIAVEGFAGVSVTAEGLQVNPSLPDGWKRMAFYVRVRGRLYRVEITQSTVDVQEMI